MSLASLMNWFHPKEDVFFDFLDRAATNVRASAGPLDEALRLGNRQAFEALLRSQKDLVAQSVDLAQEIVDQMQHTLVTPLDQEDILAIAQALKAVGDRLRAVSERLVYFNVGVVPVEACELSGLVLKGSEELVHLMGLLHNRKNFQGMAADIQRVRTLANEAQEVFRKGLLRIIDQLIDPIELIKQKELLEQIMDASDRIERVAKAVGLAVLRNG